MRKPGSQLRQVSGILIGCLLVADIVSCAVNRLSSLQLCVRKRRDTRHLGLNERVKRCSGGGGGGMERMVVIGHRDPFSNFISDPMAIRGFLDSFSRTQSIGEHFGGGGGPQQNQADKDCYGKVENVDTSGASSATASQDGLKTAGVTASTTMAQSDLARLDQFKSKIMQVSKETGMDAAVVAAIVSRESRAGNALRADGYGKYDSNGFGLMQVDKNHHTPQGTKDSVEHLRQGVQILQGMIKGVKNCHPSWTNEQVLKGGVSAYNAGVGNVRTYDRMDVGTTGNDYANDVIARAKYLKKNGYGDPKDQKCSGGKGRRRRAACSYSWFNPKESTPRTSSHSSSTGTNSHSSSRGSSGSSRPSLLRERERFGCSGSRRCMIP